MQRLFIEAPCFGFGPISTSISIARHLDNEYDITFITFGEALDFLNKSTKYKCLELDTRYDEYFTDVIPYISFDDMFIVNTNIEFSTFLISRGHNVLVIDTLYWMWNSAPREYLLHQNFIAQCYYSGNIGNLPNKVECRPIIDYDMWEKKEDAKKSNVLISFGGMAEPGDHTYFLEYAFWMIEKIVSYLQNEEIINVYVVGGLFKKDEPCKYSDKVKILGCLDVVQFNELVNECKYLFLSPGLTSIYEMIFSQRTFCLLPGLNVSQIYQVYHFNKDCTYPYCILWPDVQDLIDKFNVLPELDGINYLEDYLTQRLNKENIGFESIINEYIQAVNEKHLINNNDIRDKLFNYDSIESLTAIFLDKMRKGKQDD